MRDNMRDTQIYGLNKAKTLWEANCISDCIMHSFTQFDLHKMSNWSKKIVSNSISRIANVCLTTFDGFILQTGRHDEQNFTAGKRA